MRDEIIHQGVPCRSRVSDVLKFGSQNFIHKYSSVLKNLITQNGKIQNQISRKLMDTKICQLQKFLRILSSLQNCLFVILKKLKMQIFENLIAIFFRKLSSLEYKFLQVFLETLYSLPNLSCFD